MTIKLYIYHGEDASGHFALPFTSFKEMTERIALDAAGAAGMAERLLAHDSLTSEWWQVFNEWDTSECEVNGSRRCVYVHDLRVPLAHQPSSPNAALLQALVEELTRTRYNLQRITEACLALPDITLDDFKGPASSYMPTSKLVETMHAARTAASYVHQPFASSEQRWHCLGRIVSEDKVVEFMAATAVDGIPLIVRWRWNFAEHQWSVTMLDGENREWEHVVFPDQFIPGEPPVAQLDDITPPFKKI